MRTFAAFFVTILMTGAAAAADCEAELASLRALYDVRQQIIEGRPYNVNTRIDAQIDSMREPFSGGGHRWVRWVKPSGDGPVRKVEHVVGRNFDEGQLETFEASGEHPYAIRIVAPRKRSTFKANREAYVGRVEIRYSVDGKTNTITRELNQWLSPDTMKTIDLGVVADSAEVSVETSARRAGKKESLIEIHFKQAVAEDDPDNPAYEGILSLLRLRNSIGSSASDPFGAAVAVDMEIARLEARLFPGLYPLPYATIAMRTRESDRLIRSEKPEEQERGRNMLAETLRLLR